MTENGMFTQQRVYDFEDTRQLAEFAWKNAPNLCDQSGECRDYHRIWSMIRHLELGGVAPAGEGFYSHALSPLRNVEQPRILISGGADSGLLANAVAAFQGAQARPKFIFVDICPTPVAQNKQFGELAGLDLECIQSNILELELEPVDAVLAHSFLGFFEPQDRPKVVATWARVLKPGGVALVANTTASEPGIVRSPEDRPEFAERAARLRELAKDEYGYADDELDALQQTAAEFPFSRKRQSAATEAEIRSWLDAAGFALELVGYDTSKQTRGPASRLDPKNRFLRTAFLARKI